jgi:hypothetical protein
MSGRLLVLNCHEAWIHQLRHLNWLLDIVVDLPGRHTRTWDTAMRPLPPKARTITLAQALSDSQQYDCIVAHNPTDLLDTRELRAPRLLILHLTLEGMVVEQRPRVSLEDYRSSALQYAEQIGAHTVAVSELKAASWGVRGEIVPLSVDTLDYLPWIGGEACGLRIANFFRRRARTLLLDFHNKAFGDLPVTIVGHNPELPGASVSADWADLKRILQRHRFYIHTADPQLEDGYNMATLEAMGAGLPVLGNWHPTSPIIHGVSGFLSDDPRELNLFARKLLDDRSLAADMGRAARETVTERFSPEAFREAMLHALDAARDKFQLRSSRQSLNQDFGFHSPTVFPSRSANQANVPVGMSTGGTSVLPPSPTALSR